jgi:hypothetical protein
LTRAAGAVQRAHELVTLPHLPYLAPPCATRTDRLRAAAGRALPLWGRGRTPPPPHLTAWCLSPIGPPPTLPHHCAPLKGCRPSSPPLGPTLPLSYYEWTASTPSRTPCIFSAADHWRVVTSPVLKLSAAVTFTTPVSAAPRSSSACFLCASPPPPPPLAIGPHWRGAPPPKHRCYEEMPPLPSPPPPHRRQGNPVSSAPNHLARRYPRPPPMS